MGVGDQVPPAIEQLGAKVEMIGAEDLAWGNLSRFDTIVTGVRAYERREDLRANNSRLLDYVQNGGTLIVQYNKFEFNEAQYGPYPGEGQQRSRHRRARAGHGAGGRRSAPEHAQQDHRRRVERLGAGARPVLSRRRPRLAVPGSAPDRGSVSSQQGREERARWSRRRTAKAAGCTSASGLWRELPAGVDGAYQLLANLISLGKPVDAGICAGARRGHQGAEP